MGTQDKKKYPLALLQSWAQLLTEVRSIARDNYLLVLVNSDNGDGIGLKDRDPSSEFHFRIFGHTLDGKGNLNVEIYTAPASKLDIRAHKFGVDQGGAIVRLNKWIEVLKEYDSISLTEEDQFTKYYEDQFYAEFEIVDDDANSLPFEDHRQHALLKLLDNIKERVEQEDKNDPQIQSIIEDAEFLENNIQRLTKKDFIRRFSKLMSKAKMFGHKLLKDIVDAGKKEIIKRVISGPLDNAQDIIERFL